MEDEGESDRGVISAFLLSFFHLPFLPPSLVLVHFLCEEALAFVPSLRIQLVGSFPVSTDTCRCSGTSGLLGCSAFRSPVLMIV